MNSDRDVDLDAPIVVVGNGGHARAVSEVIRQLGWKTIYFTVTNDSGELSSRNKNVIEPPNDWSSYFFVAIGDNKARQREYDDFLFRNKDAKSLTIISAQSHVASTAKVDDGCVVMPFSSINAHSHVGRGCIVNTASIIEHDSYLGEFVSFAPGSVAGGGVRVGDFSTIGLGAVVSNDVTLGAECILGANSLLLTDLPQGVRALGSPARIC